MKIRCDMILMPKVTFCVFCFLSVVNCKYTYPWDVPANFKLFFPKITAIIRREIVQVPF
jgi:hypothetical protein